MTNIVVQTVSIGNYVLSEKKQILDPNVHHLGVSHSGIIDNSKEYIDVNECNEMTYILKDVKKIIQKLLNSG